ncbi:MAG: hypothetical protein WAU78_02475 [Roseiarcus sp.]
MNVGLFVAGTVGYAVGSFRDPVIILFALICGAAGYSRARVFWPLALSILLTAFGTIMAHFVWQTPASVSQWWGAALIWRFYINCVIGYLAYGLLRVGRITPAKVKPTAPPRGDNA